MGLFLISTIIMLGLLYLSFYAKWDPNILSSFVILITIYLVFWGLCTYSHFSSFDYQKYKLEKLFPDNYDKNKTGSEIMTEVGYNTIFDAGNLVFEWIK